MNTPRTSVYGLMTLILVIGLTTVGCKKKCFPYDGQPIEGLTKQQLRLVETTDPNATVDQYNSLVLTMGDGFDWQYNKLDNNRYFDTPILSGTYRIDSDGKSGTVEFSVADGTDKSKFPAKLTWDYTRSSKEVTFVDQATGAEYVFIRYSGVLATDVGDCQL